MQVVVLPTPPFWFATAITLAKNVPLLQLLRFLVCFVHFNFH
jgi:hypothetical protein